MIDLGMVRPGSTIRIPFSTYDKDDGSSITMTNFAAADILVYKDGGTTERASTNGFTATTDFDSKTGKQLIVIDLSDDTTAGFWTAGSEYLVAVDAVTVDAVTTGGWVARFHIGYPSAVLNTTIATLASQTSFTLTSGPAEDDALNDMWAIIHDVASAVQFAKVLILDYTGSTKTVTLAAGGTFTAAASDNFSVMDLAPIQAAIPGRKPVVDASGLVDANAVKVGPTGSGTAQTANDLGAINVTNLNTLSGHDPGENIMGATDLDSTLTAIAGYIDTEVAAIKAKTDNLPASPAATGDCITAAGIRTAVGLASANLDDQLAALPTASEITADVLTGTGDTGVTLAKAIEMLAALAAGKVSASSNAGVTTLTYKKRDGSTTSFTVVATEADNTRATTGSLS